MRRNATRGMLRSACCALALAMGVVSLPGLAQQQEPSPRAQLREVEEHPTIAAPPQQQQL